MHTATLVYLFLFPINATGKPAKTKKKKKRYKKSPFVIAGSLKNKE